MSSTESPSVLLIVNPVSGQGDFDESMETIKNYLDERGSNYEIRETQGGGDALNWAKDARGFDLIAVGGGDGTVMEAMSGMVKNPVPVPLAQLPLGTANLLARSLAIPGDLEEALDIAFEKGVVVSLDVGYLPTHDRYFAIVAGAGWDAELIEDADRDMKDKLGFFAYIFSGVKHLFDDKISRVRVEIDGNVKRFRAQEVMVINIGEVYKSGLALGEGLSPHDGKLDLAIASTKNVWGLIKLLTRIVFRKFDDYSDLRYFSVSHLRVEANPPLKLEIDGEAIGETPFEVEVVPAGARLIVSSEYIEAKNIDSEGPTPTSRK